MSATRGETLTPNPNECNSTLTSGTRGIYPDLYIAEESVPCAKFIKKCPAKAGSKAVYNRRVPGMTAYWWFAYDVINSMIMQILIDLSQILIWPIRSQNVSPYQL